MSPTLWDHAFVVALLVIVPIWGRIDYRRFVRKLAAGDRRARVRMYAATLASEWTLCAIVLALWLACSRPLGALGIALPPGWPTIGGAAATAVGLAFLLAQWRAISRLDASGLESLRPQIAGAAEVVPRTEEEHRRFRLVALTAGIVEETVYRGYLIAYLSAFLGTAPAVVAAAAAFGAAHVYQGGSGVLKTGIAGLVAGVLYVATGSLLWPIVLHAVVDLQGGAIGRRVLGGAEAAAEEISE